MLLVFRIFIVLIIFSLFYHIFHTILRHWMCWCAVRKLLTHSLTQHRIQSSSL